MIDRSIDVSSPTETIDESKTIFSSFLVSGVVVAASSEQIRNDLEKQASSGGFDGVEVKRFNVWPTNGESV